MANHLLAFRPIGTYACAIPCHHKPDSNRRKNTTTSSSSASWWAPMFALSSELDYIDSENKTEFKEKRQGKSEKDRGRKSARSKFFPGCFTEVKARQLRMMTTNASSFYDVMYHSAIATRLASDFKDRCAL